MHRAENMVVTGACICSGRFSPVVGRKMTPSLAGKNRRFPASTEQLRASAVNMPTVSDGIKFRNSKSMSLSLLETSELEKETKSLSDYFDEVKDLIRSDAGDGPPRWFSPLECGAHDVDSPLLLYLPGIDGVGLGLVRHHPRLGKIFDIWCLHIPVKDRTSFQELVKQVERTVRSESNVLPNRPIYVVGESLGACIALAVAAANPDIDLVLILVNPATSFNKSYLQSVIPLLKLIPDQLALGLQDVLSSLTDDPLRIMMNNVPKELPLQRVLPHDIFAVSSSISVVADILPKETLIWKLKMLQSSSAFVMSRLHAVKAQTLVLSSGRDQLLPSEEEGVRLRRALSKCDLYRFNNNGHFLLLEDGVDLVTIIKGAGFYRRGKVKDYVSDYFPPTPSEFKSIYESNRLMVDLTSPVMLSTLSDGKIVRGLAGIPSEGPVLLVGYHMLLGLELASLATQFLVERNILVRGIAHPMMFVRPLDGPLPELQAFDAVRIMGAVPASGANMYKLLSSNSHVLLYPGGVREALHRKGEAYKLFWPESSEFVRMASRFGAKIIPFGVVGEDDISELLLDYDDQMRIPFLRNLNEQVTKQAVRLRADASGEVANQDLYLPGIVPKLPGRFYFYFGKPIETQGRRNELKDKEKAQELYLQVKSEVEKCLAYLKDKREYDPYRSLVSRILYQATNGLGSEIPTFKITD